MTRRLTFAIGLVIAAAATVACGGTSVTEITGPSSVRCETAFASPPPTVSAGGGQVNISVAAARECNWTVASEAGWIGVSPSSGQGEATLTISVNPNQAASRGSHHGVHHGGVDGSRQHSQTALFDSFFEPEP